MEIAILGALVGLVSAAASVLVPGISLIEACLIYVIVSICTVTLQSAMTIWAPADSGDRR